MDWKDVGRAVASAAPVLGTLLGGPAGAAVGAIIASTFGVEGTPDAVSEALKVSPDAAVKLQELEAKRQASISAVNATMQAEVAAEHWPSYSWRPFVGFVFGVMFIGVYFILPLAKTPVPVVPTEAWMAIGAVLGVASWFRGSPSRACEPDAKPRLIVDQVEHGAQALVLVDQLVVPPRRVPINLGVVVPLGEHHAIPRQERVVLRPALKHLCGGLNTIRETIVQRVKALHRVHVYPFCVS